jgi:preprotein translocase subunit YajC
MNDDKDASDRLRSIQVSLNSIVDGSTRLLQRLRSRERSVRIASSLLTAFLGLGILAIVGSIVSQSTLYYLFFFHPRVGTAVLGSSFFAMVASGIITYLLLKRRNEARLKELSSLIIEMRKAGQQSVTGHGITEDAISLVDRVTTLLPQLVRKRRQDSLLLGLVAFVISEVVANSLPVAVLIGVLVWLYFRYENSRSYEREISKLEMQRRDFEKRRNDLLEKLNVLT